MNRRSFFAAGLSALALAGAGVAAKAAAAPKIDVFKVEGCGCCDAWITYLEAENFDVAVHSLPNDALAGLKTSLGVGDDYASCHTAKIDGYVIEGHVAAEDIRRLLSERPAATGLAVPGMPMGSPGMGPVGEPYRTYLLTKDGQASVFSERG